MEASTKDFLGAQTSKVAELQEERVIATFYGCILRRLQTAEKKGLFVLA